MRTRYVLALSTVGSIFTMMGTMIASVMLGGLIMLIMGPENALPPCPTEDSVSCHWDGSKHGNGKGRSYWTDGSGTPHYLP